MESRIRTFISILVLTSLLLSLNIACESEDARSNEVDFAVVDTGQETCYDNDGEITPPQPGEPFYGQDVQYLGMEFTYVDNGDGTITDLNTGLMWQKTPDFDERMTWRVPSGAIPKPATPMITPIAGVPRTMRSGYTTM